MGCAPILKTGKWRLTETKPHPQGHVADQCQSQGSTPCLAGSKASELSRKPNGHLHSFTATPTPSPNSKFTQRFPGRRNMGLTVPQSSNPAILMFHCRGRRGREEGTVFQVNTYNPPGHSRDAAELELDPGTERMPWPQIR